MQKSIEERPVFEQDDLDSIVLAFESANLGEQSADLDDFLPDETHPQHASILRELIRLDMEFSWATRRTSSAGGFSIALSWSVFADRAALQEMAFEEYRLRLGSGERPTVAEYEAGYEIDCSDWPQADVAEDASLSDPSELSEQGGMEDRFEATRVMAHVQSRSGDAERCHGVYRLPIEQWLVRS